MTDGRSRTNNSQIRKPETYCRTNDRTQISHITGIHQNHMRAIHGKNALMFLKNTHNQTVLLVPDPLDDFVVLLTRNPLSLTDALQLIADRI